MMNPITLITNQESRLWLTGGGFERVLEFVRKICELTYPVSSRTPLQRTPEFFYFDFDTDARFDLYDSNTHPPVGYRGLFLCPCDCTPGPWGTIAPRPSEDFSRYLVIASGTIVPNPPRELFDDDVPNAHDELVRTKRRTTLHCDWELTVIQEYRAGRPTRTFHFNLDNNPSSITAGLMGLFQQVNTTPLHRSDVESLPGVKALAGKRGITIGYSLLFLQKWDHECQRWRGVVKASVKTGLFSSEESEFFVE